jgi:hypothetical protein
MMSEQEKQYWVYEATKEESKRTELYVKRYNNEGEPIMFRIALEYYKETLQNMSLKLIGVVWKNTDNITEANKVVGQMIELNGGSLANIQPDRITTLLERMGYRNRFSE